MGGHGHTSVILSLRGILHQEVFVQARRSSVVLVPYRPAPPKLLGRQDQALLLSPLHGGINTAETFVVSGRKEFGRVLDTQPVACSFQRASARGAGCRHLSSGLWQGTSALCLLE